VDKWTSGQVDKWTSGQVHTWTYEWTYYKQADIQMDKGTQSVIYMDRQVSIYLDKQTNWRA